MIRTPPPDAAEQVRFLRTIQRLLEETRTTSTYKFALLLALADLSVERGADSGAALPLKTRWVAAKFAAYYWQQTLPFETASGLHVLRQNTDREPRVLKYLAQARKQGASLTDVLGDARLLKRIQRAVCEMPLPRLQRIGKTSFEFLYGEPEDSEHVELRPGAAFCFRRFHGLIRDLVQGAWVRFVRELNAECLGARVDLAEFLFGSRRSDLAAARRALEEVEGSRCFYCRREIPPVRLHLDHFVPRSRYPVDLGHNLVLSDRACNSLKADRLPAIPHLRRWVDRNTGLAPRLEQSFARHGVSRDLDITLRVACWAYTETEASEGLTWERAQVMVPLESGWRALLNRYGST